MDNHFKIFIPFYNVERWAPYTIKSVMRQEYKNFQCILVDDMSTDRSCDVIESLIKDDDRFVLVKNKEKKYVIENMCLAFDLVKPNKEDVVVVLDGDDWFAGKTVLSILDETYNKEQCWLTYGSYVEYPSMTVGKFAKKIPEQVIEQNAIRRFQWVTGHLQTFKFGLWQNLDKEKSFKEPNSPHKDHHFMYGWDLAWMIPLVELAGKKSHYIADILYVYNRENPLNCDKVKHSQQLLTEQTVRSMARYNPLEKL
jgi:glycosyltransferase involved in cell wall biosynthesis